VWSKVHESTERTLAGKKGSFYLARPLVVCYSPCDTVPETVGKPFLAGVRHYFYQTILHIVLRVFMYNSSVSQATTLAWRPL